MRHAPHACPHLLEAHNVWVRQQAVVDDFSLHILCDLQGRVCTHEVVNGMKASPGDMAVSCSVLIDVQTTCAEGKGGQESRADVRPAPRTDLVAPLDELDGDLLPGVLIAAELNEAERARVEVLDLFHGELKGRSHTTQNHHRSGTYSMDDTTANLLVGRMPSEGLFLRRHSTGGWNSATSLDFSRYKCACATVINNDERAMSRPGE